MKRILIGFPIVLAVGTVGIFVWRPSQPSVMRVTRESPELEQAIKQATEGLPAFKIRVAKRAPGMRFAVRVRFSTDFGPEYLWVKEPVFASGMGIGLLDQPPVAYRLKQRGDSVSFPEAEIVDWLIQTPDGQREGGFTDRALMK